MKQAILDFESDPIEQRPKYPPKPVGLAFKIGNEAHYYAAWNHPEDNGLYRLTRDGGKTVLVKSADPKRAAMTALNAAKKCDSILGHNIAKFDADLSETHMGVKLPAHKIDDSLFSRFLVNPHARSLSLKPSAEEVLGEKPEERDAVFWWLANHGFLQKPKIKKGKEVWQKGAGAHIGKAPGSLVAAYAIGDLTRSKGLFDHDMRIIKHDGMLDAYRLEQRVAPILLENERRGMRVDVERLEKDVKTYRAARLKVEAWLRKKLQAPAGINWNSDDEVAAALRRSGQVKEFPKTKTGRDSVSSKWLTKAFFRDPDVYLALVYRNIVDFVLGHNIEPWLEEATQTGGWIHTQWNQVRSDKEKGGARSGRITCSGWAAIIKTVTDKNPEYQRADDERIRGLIGLPALPLARVYCLPDEGGSFIHVDWNQQELRLLAHYEEALLAQAYREDPSLKDAKAKKVDIHQFVTDLVLKVTSKQFKRDVIKHVNFRTVYGGGREGLVEHPMLRFDAIYKCRHKGLHREARCLAYKAADEVLTAWGKALPDVVRLSKRLSAMYERGDPVRTFGGRLYRVKPATVVEVEDEEGNKALHTRTYEYTALNYLLQPGGADLMKMAIVRYHEHPKRRGRMLCTVYDEMNSSAPKKIAKQEQKVIQEVMESIKLDVPWRTDGDVRPNWGTKEAT